MHLTVLMLNFNQSNRITNSLGESIRENSIAAAMTKPKFVRNMEIERFFHTLTKTYEPTSTLAPKTDHRNSECEIGKFDRQ